MDEVFIEAPGFLLVLYRMKLPRYMLFWSIGYGTSPYLIRKMITYAL